MAKLNSPADLEALREKARAAIAPAPGQITLAVGMATCGVAAGARAAYDALRDELTKAGRADVHLMSTGCVGFCYAEPIVEVREAGKPPVRYGSVDEARAREIVQKHILKGELIDHAVIGQEVNP